VIPGLVVSAPGSGQGKTTVVCAVAAALGRRGLDVRTFKAGPDYLDPSWHMAVTGRPSRNLDGWMTGPDGVRRSYARGARGGELGLVEGVMGLFDGRDPRGLEGSAAELAMLLGLPVVLVVDASGMARSAAAVVHGFVRYQAGVDVVGVIYNRVGSTGHGRLLAEATQSVPGMRFLGAMPGEATIGLPERHLGLVSAALGAPPGWVDRLAALAEAHLDLDALRGLARLATAPQVELPAPPAPVARIGVAWDEAFHFYYADNLDLLTEAGAELVPFSPLRDPGLPEGLDGLLLGGGYPEAHAAALSANAGMIAAIRAFDGPIYAECGGLMYLGESLDGVPLVGRLPLRTRMGPRLRALGYREVRTLRDTLLGPAGTVFRGHEFRYSELDGPPGLEPAWHMTGTRGEGPEGWGQGRVLGSYVHAHFGSNPALAVSFVAACRRGR